jgi:hypothetical protein
MTLTDFYAELLRETPPKVTTPTPLGGNRRLTIVTTTGLVHFTPLPFINAEVQYEDRCLMQRTCPKCQGTLVIEVSKSYVSWVDFACLKNPNHRFWRTQAKDPA